MAKAAKKVVKKKAQGRLTTRSAPLARVVPTDRLLSDLRTLIETAREQVARTVNSALVGLYWHIGKRIREDVLNEQRAGYGEQVVEALSRQLTSEYGKGYSRRSLFRMVRFAEVFSDEKIVSSLMTQLSWTHLIYIIPLENPLKRDFYAEMCRIERWSTRTLQARINSLLFERTAISKKPEITVDGDDYYLDLLFYHRRLRRLVAIDLKLGKFQAADKGQMELYLRWLEKHDLQPGEEPPVGLILCADKSEEHVELLQLDRSGVRVAQYLTELPSQKILEKKLHAAVELAREKLARKNDMETGNI